MYNYYNYNNDRVGFLGPFILGGITGGLVAPYFYNNQYKTNQSNYNTYPNFYPPQYIYIPYNPY